MTTPESCRKGGKIGNREGKSRGGQIGGKISGKKAVESGQLRSVTTPESLSKGGKIGGKIAGKITSSQKWKCLVTGHVSSPGALSNYQKSRGIDTNQRIRVK
jgi:hypothetical protein